MLRHLLRTNIFLFIGSSYVLHFIGFLHSPRTETSQCGLKLQLGTCETVHTQSSSSMGGGVKHLEQENKKATYGKQM